MTRARLPSRRPWIARPARPPPEIAPRSPASSWRSTTCWRRRPRLVRADRGRTASPAPACRRRCCRCWWRRCGGRASSWPRAAWWWWSTTTRPRTPWPSRRRLSAGSPVAYLPSRGAAYGSGLDPRPHLVGERVRALDALARGGLVAVSADALVERVRRSTGGRRWWSSTAGPSRASTRSSNWPRPATSGSTRSRSAASSPCAAAWSTCSRPPAASRSGSSSSATRSSGCRPSRSSPSARCASSTARSCIPAAEPGDLEPDWGARRTSR